MNNELKKWLKTNPIKIPNKYFNIFTSLEERYYENFDNQLAKDSWVLFETILSDKRHGYFEYTETSDFYSTLLGCFAYYFKDHIKYVCVQRGDFSNNKDRRIYAYSFLKDKLWSKIPQKDVGQLIFFKLCKHFEGQFIKQNLEFFVDNLVVDLLEEQLTVDPRIVSVTYKAALKNENIIFLDGYKPTPNKAFITKQGDLYPYMICKGKKYEMVVLDCDSKSYEQSEYPLIEQENDLRKGKRSIAMDLFFGNKTPKFNIKNSFFRTY